VIFSSEALKHGREIIFQARCFKPLIALKQGNTRLFFFCSACVAELVPATPILQLWFKFDCLIQLGKGFSTISFYHNEYQLWPNRISTNVKN